MSYISAHTMIKPITKAPKRREVGPLLSEHAVRRFFGLVFGFAAIGLWLLPSANELAQVLLLKTGFTAILSFAALWHWFHVQSTIHRVLEHPTFDGLTSDRRTIQLTA